jgi:hypothetical protein
LSERPARYEGPGPNDDGFDPEKHFWDFNVWWTADRLFWWDGAQWQSRDAPHASGLAGAGEAPISTRKPRPPGYWRDFWLGFAGVIVVNVLFFIVYSQVIRSVGAVPGSLLNLAPWILNIGGIIAFAIVRPRVALGMLLAYGVAFALVLLVGIFLLVLCFSMTRGPSVP